MKQKKLICYFITNQDSLYYQSPLFTKVLSYVQQNQNRCKLKERNGRLSLVFEQVPSIVKAIELLEKI